jgi:transposase InsO family protein
MSGAVRLGIGTRLVYDGEVVTVEQLFGSAAGCEVLARDGRGRPLRLSLRELLTAERARVVPAKPGPASDDAGEVAATVLAQLSEAERVEVLERAAQVRELLTGYRSGSAEMAAPGEPRSEYGPGTSLMARYAAKAAELGIGERTIERWVQRFQEDAEAGLVRGDGPHRPGVVGMSGLGRADSRWVETALEVMAEHTDQSKPSHSIVIRRTAARLAARHGSGVVSLPSRATAYRWLQELEERQPTFRLSTKRNRDIAARPGAVYGKLRPTRPGEYLLLDTTRLDVFALDPLTLRWVQAELTAAMDWYTRCITGVRLTPVSTKSVDASSVLYQTYRPRPAGASWPQHAVWPDHGIPRAVLLDINAIEGPMAEAAASAGWVAPALAPETVVVDHGMIYVSEHLTSVCQRMGISVQPARLRTGRDKGPLERFFRTLREDLLEALPGYKGPDLPSRGLDPEGQAFFFLNELEAIIREWIAGIYHHTSHKGLVDPHLPGLRLSPAAMFEHGLQRAGYVEVPRDPDLGFEFLQTKWRQIHHYGIEIRRRRYNGPALDPYREITSPYTGKAKGRWPIQVDPDDINRVYFRDPASGRWHALIWEHAPAVDMPLSDEALQFARRMAAAKYTYPDDELAVADLLERWNLGLGMSMAERRIALRISRDQAAIDLPSPDEVSSLPSVRKVLELPAVATSEPGASQSAGTTAGRARKPEPEPEPPKPGDDDDVDELDSADGDLAEDDFYADALEDVE